MDAARAQKKRRQPPAGGADERRPKQAQQPASKPKVHLGGGGGGGGAGGGGGSSRPAKASRAPPAVAAAAARDEESEEEEEEEDDEEEEAAAAALFGGGDSEEDGDGGDEEAEEEEEDEEETAAAAAAAPQKKAQKQTGKAVEQRSKAAAMAAVRSAMAAALAAEENDDDDEEEEQEEAPAARAAAPKRTTGQEGAGKAAAQPAAAAAEAPPVVSAQQQRLLDKQALRDMGKYVNKQRTLVFCTRGITERDRHLMEDLRDILPHSKRDVKLDTKDRLSIVNEVADMKSCNNVVFFEARKKKDLYMWVSRCPQGPSIKFCVENVHTMAETKLTGNSLKGSRPILSFDAQFDAVPVFRLVKELFIQVFGTPKGYPKAKPFIDHVFSFFIVDGRIWFRNYQVEHGAGEKNISLTSKLKEPVLVEIGPRFALNPIKVFDGSFFGATLWENSAYISPNAVRSAERARKQGRYNDRKQQQRARGEHVEEAEEAMPEDPLEDVFA